MSDRRRWVLRVVFWIVAISALAAGLTLGALDHLLPASAVLIGSVLPLAVIGWFAGYMSGGSGRFDPERAWKTGTGFLIVGAAMTLAGVVLLSAVPGSLGYVLLMAGPAMVLGGLFNRYTIRMDHPDAPDFTDAEATQRGTTTPDRQAV